MDEFKRKIEELESKNQTLQRKLEEERDKAQQALQAKDIAFKELLEQLDLERKSIQKDIMINVDNLLMPSIKKLQRKGTSFEEKHLLVLEKNLKEITSSFGNHMGKVLQKLTPRELEICNMIRNGLTIKEIADLLYTSPRTVETHRNNIRKKLGLSKKKVNLAIYLRTL